jgi:SAM-dependent methyltransferase
MRADAIATALHYLPALGLIGLVVYAAYWTLGLTPWPRLATRERLFNWFGRVDLEALGGFKVVRLALISLVSLYLELLLIRWVSSEIRVFAFFKSLVLIACFLGFGLGCYLTRAKIQLAYLLVPLLALVLLIELPWEPVRQIMAALSDLIGWLSDIHIWAMAHFKGSLAVRVGAAGIAITIILALFGLIAVTFVPLGQLVGWYLEKAPDGVRAYSVNVAASIVGIWLYTILCFAWSPPPIWIALFGAGLLLYLWPLRAVRAPLVISLGLILGLMLLGIGKAQWWAEDWRGTPSELPKGMTAGQPEKHWSPYQKLTLIPLVYDGHPVSYLLNTNDSWYQRLVDLSPATVAKYPALYEQTPLPFHQYNLPYRFFPSPPRVLIAGAGAGNDASSAVRNGAGHVVAVEIDPLIVSLGRRLHFEHPYQSDRVEVRVDDARAFVQSAVRKGERYDLIVFSILDSHTTSSYYTNIRLDNYVYTVEALRGVKQLLAPDGLFVMSFSGARPWFAGRLHAIVTEAMGRPPLMLKDGMYYFVAGDSLRIAHSLAADTALGRFVEAHANPPIEPATTSTDDWPYLYQQTRGIPLIVWLLSGGLIAVCALAIRRFKRSEEPFLWHFFFLGAAFMLLEVQIISKTALLFGTTWLVNSIVITALLLFILLANLVVRRVTRFPRALAYAGLFLTLALAYFIPAEALFFESRILRALAVAVVYCSPVFFAGVVFISSFRAIGFRAEAFGANLLGSLVGGLLESASYAIGIRALVLMAAALYAASLLTASRARAAVPLAEPVPATGR